MNNLKKIGRALTVASCFTLLHATSAIGAPDTGTTHASGTGMTTGTSTSTTSNQDINLSSRDKKFMAKAAQGGMAEVAIGKMAAMRAADENVKKFGQQMVDDHSKANSELEQIAAKKGMPLPKELSREDKKTSNRLEKLQGKEFDQAYIHSAGIKDHKKAIDLFEREAKNGKDADLKGFAEKTLPVIRHHHQMAEELARASGR